MGSTQLFSNKFDKILLKFRLMTNRETEERLTRFCGSARFVWNKSLALNLKRLVKGQGLLWYNGPDWRGGMLVAVNARYTSQMCSYCGHLSNENRRSQLIFQCQLCGHKENADINAAKNILTVG
jgi:transposase